MWIAGCGPGGAGAAKLLDPSFGKEGTTLTAFSCASDFAFPNALVAVDGGFIAAGKACRGWGLVGYTSNGALDSSYGDGGTVSVFAGDGDFSDVRALVARPDGRVIVWGVKGSTELVRQFSAAGVLDSAFAAAVDQAVVPFGPLVQAMALQPDGKLLLGARTEITRINVDGTRDTLFGNGGTVSVELFARDTFMRQLLVRPDGGITIVGYDTAAGLPGIPFVAQLSALGALEASFGTHGVVKVPPPTKGGNMVNAATLQEDGKIVLAGSDYPDTSIEGPTRPVVWRLTQTGVLDSTFGTDGRAEGRSKVGNNLFYGVSVLADGKIVAAGAYQEKVVLDSWQVARFTPAGVLDSTFGSAGTSVFDVGVAATNGGATTLVTTPSGYVIAGRAYPTASGPAVFGLARLKPQ